MTMGASYLGIQPSLAKRYNFIGEDPSISRGLTAKGASGATGSNTAGFLGGIGTGMLSGAPLGPIGMIGGGILGAAGSYLNAQAEEKRLEEERKQRERQMNINSIGMMKNDYQTSLYNVLKRGGR